MKNTSFTSGLLTDHIFLVHVYGDPMQQLELIKRIKELKLKQNAVILAHYYSRPEVQDIADFVEETGIRELMVISQIFDQKKKLHSYSLVQEIFNGQ